MNLKSVIPFVLATLILAYLAVYRTHPFFNDPEYESTFFNWLSPTQRWWFFTVLIIVGYSLSFLLNCNNTVKSANMPQQQCRSVYDVCNASCMKNYNNCVAPSLKQKIQKKFAEAQQKSAEYKLQKAQEKARKVGEKASKIQQEYQASVAAVWNPPPKGSRYTPSEQGYYPPANIQYSQLPLN